MTKKKKLKLLGFAGLLIFFLTMGKPVEVKAMHIMEGFLPPIWSAIWFLIFMPFFILGVRNIGRIVKEHPEQKMLLALSGAFIFILSALKLPSVTGSTSHPTGVGIGTVFFGPSVISVLGTICLLFQSLLLAHGGLSTLGANAFSMAVVGPFVGYGVYRLARKLNVNQAVSIFLCAALADLSTYMMTSIQLGIVFPDAAIGVLGTIIKFMGVFCLTQIPIAIAEGLLTVVMYNLISTYIPNVQVKGGVH